MSGFTQRGTVPIVALSSTGTESLTNDTWHLINFSAESEDNLDAHSVSSNVDRVIIPVSGVYAISGRAVFATNATGERSTGVSLQGNDPAEEFITTVPANAVASAVTVVNFNHIIRLTLNQNLRIFIKQSSGGALDLLRSRCYLRMVKIAV